MPAIIRRQIDLPRRGRFDWGKQMWPRQGKSTMRMVGLSIALLATALTIDRAHADDAAAKALLSDAGKLWVGIVVGPTPGPGRVVGPAAPGRGPGKIVRDGLHGVEVDL